MEQRTLGGATAAAGPSATGPSATGLTDENAPAPGTIRPMHPWEDAPADRLVDKGHPAGDFLEAHDWPIIREERGLLRIEAHLPDRVKNPRGQLFGGFTPTYVDLVSLFTVRAGRRHEERHWLATTNMRIDYFEPILGPRFQVEGRLEKTRGRTHVVAVRFYIGDSFDELAVFSLTTMREVAWNRTIGDA